MKVLVLVGSARTGSVNARLADAAVAMLPEGSQVTRFDISALPFYADQIDTDSDAPAVVADLRAAAGEADAIIAVTPEHNGSASAMIQNAVDWLSRPFGDAASKGTPVAVLGASASPHAAQWAREGLRRSVGIAGMAPLERTVGVGNAYASLAAGGLTAESEADVRSLVEELVAAAVPAAV